MSEEEQRPFVTRASNLPRPPPRLAPQAADPELHLEGSPWDLGSKTYPCSADTLLRTATELLPDGKANLRKAFERCLATTEPDALANVVVSNTAEKLNLPKLRAARKANSTCFTLHPGVCCKDQNFSSIVALHGGLARAFRTFGIAPDDADGQALVLFAGFQRKRDADRLLKQVARDSVQADHYEAAFLSDQPERRRGLMSWSLCEIALDEDRRFHCGSHVGLKQSDKQTVSDVVSFAFAKRLRDRAKYPAVVISMLR